MGTENNEAVFTPKMLEAVLEANPVMKISDAVYELLEEAILSSVYKPGSKIKINKIAEELEVSGTPVREAVEQLTARGLVFESVGNGSKYKNYIVFDIDDADIDALFVARKTLESTAAYLCAQKNWLVDIEALEKNTESFKKGMQDFVDGVSTRVPSEHDRMFHVALVEATGNKYLIELYNSLEKQLNYLSIRTCEFMGAGRLRNEMLRLCYQHSSVINAIKLGFPQMARQAMDEHIDFCLLNCLNNRYFDTK